jgi:ankyrin repeat protein
MYHGLLGIFSTILSYARAVRLLQRSAGQYVARCISRISCLFFGDGRVHIIALAVREMEDDVAGRELWTSAQKGCITQPLPGHTSSPVWMLRAFLVALANDHVETAAQLARAAPDLVNAQLDSNTAGVGTPLAHAAFYGCGGAIKLLLDLKAAVSPVADSWCRTPIFMAVCGGHVPVVTLLASAGVDVNEGGCNAPLFEAARAADVRMVQALVEIGADLGVKDRYGWTPMHTASFNGHSAVVHLLIRSNASVNCTNTSGEKPMHLAAIYGHVGVLKLLLDAKAGTAAADNTGRTPLAYAREYGHERAMQLLLQLQP